MRLACEAAVLPRRDTSAASIRHAHQVRSSRQKFRPGEKGPWQRCSCAGLRSRRRAATPWPPAGSGTHPEARAAERLPRLVAGGRSSQHKMQCNRNADGPKCNTKCNARGAVRVATRAIPAAALERQKQAPARSHDRARRQAVGPSGVEDFANCRQLLDPEYGWPFQLVAE